MYPKTRLTRSIRRLIMLGLILIYLIIAPIIIAYTAGYRYDFQTGEIKQTGVLSIDVKPKTAQVFINGALMKESLPIYLPNRAPGSYKIKISLPGYKDWEKDILIESKKTAYIKKVTLFKESLPMEIMKEYAKNILDVSFSPTASFSLITSEQDGVYEVDLINLNNFSSQTMIRVKADVKPEISWSPFNDFAFVKTTADETESMMLFDANNSTANKTYDFTKETSGAQWATASSIPTLYLKSGGKIISLTTDNSKELTAAVADVWYVESENAIWLKTESKGLVSTDSNGQETNKIILREETDKIIDINSSRVITGRGQDTIITQIEDKKVKETAIAPTQNIFFNQKTGEWLAWSPWELWTIYKDGKTALLNRTGEKIDYVLPLDDYGVLLLASENKITGFNPGYYITHDLLNNVQIGRIAANTEQRKIFFFGEVAEKRGLYELNY
ncbi:MAG: PEGA domain-containing protein [Candidatus Magasanikbacteria bacterium]|nr:PEGA domain-containing protein [Candidatus Magasanikbacteria bacterium]